MKKLSNILWYGLIIIVVAVAVVIKFNISIFGIHSFEVMSGSMEPSLSVGEIVVTKKSDTIKEGDIITYEEINSNLSNKIIKEKKDLKVVDTTPTYVTHRVVKIIGGTIVTKGDANNTEDQPINKKQVIGKYLFHIKKRNINLVLYGICFILLIDIIKTIIETKKK